MPASITERLAQFRKNVNVGPQPSHITSPELAQEKLGIPVPLPPGWKVLRSIQDPNSKGRSALTELIAGETIEVTKVGVDFLGLWCDDLSLPWNSEVPDYLGTPHDGSPLNVTYILVPDFYTFFGIPKEDSKIQELKEYYITKYGSELDTFLQKLGKIDRENGLPIIPVETVLVQLQPAEIRNIEGRNGINPEGILESRTFYVPEVLAQAYFDEVMPNSSS